MTATAASYESVVQDLYVTYFGRPADYFGLQNFEQALLTAGAPTTLSGLNAAYATNSAVKALVDSFGTSAESVALYGAVTTSSASAAAFVNAIYENLFNRASDVAGLTFWTNAITSGKLSLGDAALSIAAGADAAKGSSTQSATDWASVTNKVTVASNFTTALGDYPAADPNGTAIADYSGDAAAAAARSFLHTVDGTWTASAAAALDVTGAIASIVNNAPGNTFTLTTGPDTFVGGSGNNVFNATGLTFTSLDNLTGNTTGQNTLNIIDATGNLTSAPTGVTLTDIQTVNITSIKGVGSSTTLDLSSSTGLTTLNVTNTTGDDYLKVGATTAVTVNNQGGDYVEIHGGSTINATTTSEVYVYGGSGTTSINVTNAEYIYVEDVGYNTSPYVANTITSITLNNVGNGGTSEIEGDALSTLTITAGATAGSATEYYDIYSTTGKGTGELDITVSGLKSGAGVYDVTAATVSLMATTASTLSLDVTGAATLDLGGAGALTITALTNAAATAVNITGAGGVTVDLSGITAAAVDASASTGANVVSLNAAESFAGGSGGSTVTETGGVAVTVSVDGGSGASNTLLLGGTIADLSTLTATNMAHFTNFETLGLIGSYGTTTGTLDLAVLPTGIVNVELGGTAGAAITVKDGVSSTALTFESTIGQTVTYTEKTVGTNDSLTVNVGLATGTGVTNTLTAATIEKLNITSNATSSTIANTLHGTFAAATTVTITGNAGLSLDAAALPVATKIDGSAMTGYLTVTGVLTSGITITAGTGGADIVGVADSKHGDTITIGDTAKTATGAAEISVADGNNTLTFGNDASSHGMWAYAGNGNNTITMGSNTGTSSSYVSVGNGNNAITIGDLGAKSTGAYVLAGSGNNTVTIGANAGVDSSDVSVGDGNNTITLGVNSGSSQDYVTVGNGNNTITVGDYTGTGTGVFVSVGSGNNTITVGAGASDVHVGSGLNSLTLGAGAVDTLTIDVAGVNVSTYTSITGWAKGDTIATPTAISETGMPSATTSDTAAFEAAKITSLDPATATFQQFADYAVHNVAVATGNAAWFQFGGNTYIVENVNGTETTFDNGVDIMVKLVGTVDLTTATITGGHVVHG